MNAPTYWKEHARSVRDSGLVALVALMVSVLVAYTGVQTSSPSLRTAAFWITVVSAVLKLRAAAAETQFILEARREVHRDWLDVRSGEVEAAKRTIGHGLRGLLGTWSMLLVLSLFAPVQHILAQVPGGESALFLVCLSVAAQTLFTSVTAKQIARSLTQLDSLPPISVIRL